VNRAALPTTRRSCRGTPACGVKLIREERETKTATSRQCQS
jgi:hypothetical protein